ncbi:MAG: hypothetical protein J6V57_04780 [Spirochaetaceae bacterium]|nr:hypothetical protein [Spirochaetaceae bacterium]
MAKKRKLSKRDRKIKTSIWTRIRWNQLLTNDDFLERLFGSVQDADPTFSGYLVPEGKTLRYYLFNGEEIVEGYDVAVLTEEGYFIYSRPFSDNEVPF